ncbi:hypothetical protein [Algisphaera agarilytica]|uniref:Uncharacterized protein n=1 Tax=Algisphaera agarilytica TaxID=1385975 RepID=A0A7X0LL06_9BACT|nr:hypothetical protein [Algisphaera agarilytica]MBB6430156.1 hypothetical protein [Algisphaera agarilytica]
MQDANPGTETHSPEPGRPAAGGEAERILRLAADPQAKTVHDILCGQFDVLHSRAGVLLTFCAVVITTTGFSGRIIAGTNRLAQGLIILGVATVMAAAWFVFAKVTRIQWVTGEVLDEGLPGVRSVLAERDRRRQALRRATGLALVGMTFYVVAIMIMLWFPGKDAVELDR